MQHTPRCAHANFTTMTDSTPQPPRRHALWVFPFIVTLTVNGLCLLNYFLVRPSYERGQLSFLGSRLNAVSSILQLPGTAVIWANAVLHHPFHQLHREIALFVNLCFYFLTTSVVIAWARWCSTPKKSASPSLSRRRFLARTTGVAAATAGGVGAYSLFIEPRAYHVVNYSLPIADLPESLDGLRIAQLSDFHHGPWFPITQVQSIVQTTNALQPDLIFLTGDYVLQSPAYIPPAISALADLRAKSGVVAILGNHDWHEDGPLTQRCFRNVGIPLLDNTRLILTLDRQLAPYSTQGLAITGVGDLWSDRQLYDNALAGLPLDMPRLLLSHNPDIAEDPRFLNCGHRVDLILAGHLHGGQIRLPFIGSPWAPSRYHSKYANHRLVNAPSTRVFTTPGLGMTALPLRFNAPPEISLLTLRRAITMV